MDLLISVTNLFRDRAAFRSLESFLPALFKDRGPNAKLRVWVPGCATGEEAYSIAILLSQVAAKIGAPPKIQIFATDIDSGAIDAAREGVYPDTIVAEPGRTFSGIGNE